jgi:hypothetical protein
MKIPLAITDLTRMQRSCVCIAGYDFRWHCQGAASTSGFSSAHGKS